MSKCYVCKSKKAKKRDNVKLCNKCYSAIKKEMKKPHNINDTIKDFAKRMKNRYKYRNKKNKSKKFTPAKAKKAKKVKPKIKESFIKDHENLRELNDIKITNVKSDSYQINNTYWIPKNNIVFD